MHSENKRFSSHACTANLFASSVTMLINCICDSCSAAQIFKLPEAISKRPLQSMEIVSYYRPQMFQLTSRQYVFCWIQDRFWRHSIFRAWKRAFRSLKYLNLVFDTEEQHELWWWVDIRRPKEHALAAWKELIEHKRADIALVRAFERGLIRSAQLCSGSSIRTG